MASNKRLIVVSPLQHDRKIDLAIALLTPYPATIVAKRTYINST